MISSGFSKAVLLLVGLAAPGMNFEIKLPAHEEYEVVNYQPTFREIVSFGESLSDLSSDNDLRVVCQDGEDSHERFKDQWGHGLSCMEDMGRLTIKSAGEDGVFETGDDIYMSKKIDSLSGAAH
ncbi:MAG: hypothetical protein EOP06_01080 [Proteobacteria bacterium]|nr:MAG: hypothetical protein EOP06_01080 [Pseudomonadota bacterium]